MAPKQTRRRRRLQEIKLKRWQIVASAGAVVAGLVLLFLVLRPAPMPELPPLPKESHRVSAPPPHKTPATSGYDPLAPLVKEALKEPLSGAAPPPHKPEPGETKLQTIGRGPALAEGSHNERAEQLALAPVPKPAPPAAAAQPHHAVIVPRRGGPPVIAIVIDDTGVDHRRSIEAIKLPGPLTISFMTYATHLPSEIALAQSQGDQIIAHVPMEPIARHVDPGPNALLVGLSPEEIKRRLEWGLARVPQAEGINNHMGSRFTAWTPGMTEVISVLHERGLFFLDSRTTPHSVGASIAAEMGVPHVSRDVFLDDEMTEAAITTQLLRAEQVARRTGVAIAIGHPHDSTIAALRRWIPTVEAKGFKLVTLKSLLETGPPKAGISQVSATSGEEAD